MTELPDLYFRVKDNGAAVFRLDIENRQRRIEMEPIAVVNVKNGEIKAQGDRTIAPEETAEIEKWLASRRALLAERELDELRKVVDDLNRTAHWAQSNRATPEQLEEITDSLLLAMFDLRSILVRKKADRAIKSQKAD